MKPKDYPDAETIRSIFEYRDGHLYYRHDYRHKRYAGRMAGRVQKAGYKQYLQVKNNGRAYYIHRLIWIMHHGAIMDGLQIDHINGVGTDNRIENLRVVTALENNRNKRRSSRGSASGYTGVTYDKCNKGWKAHIQVNGRHYNLGVYKTVEQAREARLSANERFGFDPNHGAQMSHAVSPNSSTP